MSVLKSYYFGHSAGRYRISTGFEQWTFITLSLSVGNHKRYIPFV